MNNNTENREREIFDEMQEKQARLAKKLLLGVLGGIGLTFAIIGTAFLIAGDIYKEIGIVFLPIGLVMVALGIILFFALPTKYNYDKHKARAEKYGYIDVYAISAKLAELEARIEELEKNKNR